MFCLFILSVLLWFVYLLLYVLCSLNQGIAAKEPCAQSILPESIMMMIWDHGLVWFGSIPGSPIILTHIPHFKTHLRTCSLRRLCVRIISGHILTKVKRL